jgi:hypothetical protein
MPLPPNQAQTASDDMPAPAAPDFGKGTLADKLATAWLAHSISQLPSQPQPQPPQQQPQPPQQQPQQPQSVGQRVTGALSALGTGLGDMRTGGNPAEGHGWLGAVGATLNARNERKTAEAHYQDEMAERKRLDDVNIAHAQVQTLLAQQSMRFQDAEHKQAMVNFYKPQLDSYEDVGVPKILQNADDATIQSWLKEHPDQLKTAIPVMAGLREEKDAQGNSFSRPYFNLYDSAKMPEHELTKDEAAQLNKYNPAAGGAYVEGAKVPATTFARVWAGAGTAMTTQLNRDKLMSEVYKNNEEGRKANDEATTKEKRDAIGHDLGFVATLNAHNHDPLEVLNSASRDQKDANAILNNPQATAQQKAVANDKIAAAGKITQQVNDYYGQDALLKMRKEDEVERHNQYMEELKLRAEQDKHQADLADYTDAFGNKSTLPSKEFNKRYDAFNNSQQNKTLQTLEGSYQQFQDTVKQIQDGKGITGADSVVGLFNAIGISATPLAGKGFRINSNTIQEHATARGVDQASYQKLLKLKDGDVITPQQVLDYANIATQAYHNAYVNAANEQLRTLGYTDVLPRGNNQPIDPVTHSMYLRIAGNDPQKAAAAEQKQGWQVTAPPARQQKTTLPPAPAGKVAVQIPNMPVGFIDPSALPKFKADHPNAAIGAMPTAQ